MGPVLKRVSPNECTELGKWGVGKQPYDLLETHLVLSRGLLNATVNGKICL